MKIIISIVSILVVIILTIILVFVFYDKKTEVYIESSYNDVKIASLSLKSVLIKKNFFHILNIIYIIIVIINIYKQSICIKLILLELKNKFNPKALTKPIIIIIMVGEKREFENMH